MNTKMRIAIASVVQETCSFTPVLTGLETFQQYGLYEGDEILQRYQGIGSVGGFLAVTEEEAIDLVPLPIIRGRAGAGGTIKAEVLEFFEEKIVSGLKSVQPIDGMFLTSMGLLRRTRCPISRDIYLPQSGM